MSASSDLGKAFISVLHEPGGGIASEHQLSALSAALGWIAPCQTHVKNIFSLVHHVIIVSDSKGPIYQVRGDRSMKCLGLGGFFLFGFHWDMHDWQKLSRKGRELQSATASTNPTSIMQESAHM